LNQVKINMLTKFAVTNYRGFANRIEWDLSNPANYEFNRSVIKEWYHIWSKWIRQDEF